MTHSWGDLEKRLAHMITATERGPRQNGLFALWLALRTVDGLVPPVEFGERSQRRRVDAVTKRLHSLTLPPRLRNRIHSTLKTVATGITVELETTLADLAGVVHETLSAEAATIVRGYARSVIPAILEDASPQR